MRMNSLGGDTMRLCVRMNRVERRAAQPCFVVAQERVEEVQNREAGTPSLRRDALVQRFERIGAQIEQHREDHQKNWDIIAELDRSQVLQPGSHHSPVVGVGAALLNDSPSVRTTTTIVREEAFPN
jgi:hypothetical protein